MAGTCRRTAGPRASPPARTGPTSRGAGGPARAGSAAREARRDALAPRGSARRSTRGPPGRNRPRATGSHRPPRLRDTCRQQDGAASPGVEERSPSRESTCHPMGRRGRSRSGDTRHRRSARGEADGHRRDLRRCGQADVRRVEHAQGDPRLAGAPESRVGGDSRDGVGRRQLHGVEEARSSVVLAQRLFGEPDCLLRQRCHDATGRASGRRCQAWAPKSMLAMKDVSRDRAWPGRDRQAPPWPGSSRESPVDGRSGSDIRAQLARRLGPLSHADEVISIGSKTSRPENDAITTVLSSQ